MIQSRSHAVTFKKINVSFFLSLTLFVIFTFLSFSVAAEGVFMTKKKTQHSLSGADLNRIKAEHQIKFANKVASYAASSPSSNPWEKKKKQQKSQSASKSANWGECRDYALHKRNRCYREGRDAYRCEQMYETRTGLCDESF